ncbi:MAG: DUF4232 domain-containing protein [Dehalococcoidia bacterium]
MRTRLLVPLLVTVLWVGGCSGPRHAPTGNGPTATPALTPLAAASTATVIPAQSTAQATRPAGVSAVTPQTRPSPVATATASGMPSATPTQTLDRCHTSALALAFSGSEGAAGHIFDTFSLVNQSATACTLYGFVGAQMLDGQGRPLPTRVVRNGGMFSNQPGPAQVALQAGGVASFQAEWGDVPTGNQAACPSAARLEVTPPDETTFLILDLGGFSLAPCGSGTIDVTPVVATAPCRSAALRLGLGGEIAEPTGQHSLSLTLANLSASACVLFGYPGVALLDATGQVLPFDYTRAGDQVVTAHRPTPVILPAGGSAFVTINKYRCDRGDQSMATIIRLIPPGEMVPLTLSLAGATTTLAYCGAGDPGSTMAVSPVSVTQQDSLAHP